MSAKVQHVVSVEGSISGTVFRLDKSTSPKLGPYELMGEPTGTSPEKDQFDVQVYRHGLLFDSGRINYVGGHDGSHHFFGLKNACADANRHALNKDMIDDNLYAKWFEIGDEIRVTDVPQ